MPHIPETPGSRPGLEAALADRYVIERELGRGGNAVVYLAHDIKHDRKVALKVLSPELAVRSERFLREIQIAAKLTHPHILGLHDSGEAAGLLYYVMPYVEGESLRERLNREKQLPVEDAVRITRDVASALGEAHAQGVVHRDIKPENILLTKSGDAVVADFGIARALTAAGGGGTATEAGLAAGTPAYMSPEQGSGGAEVDARGDVYSLGCVLYEMLAGHPPFAGETAQEIVARHTLDPVPSLRAARPGVPRAVERAVAKALAKVPADRFASAAEFAGALAGPRRRLPVYAAVGVLVLAAGGMVARQTLFRSPVEQSVAVLPFANLSADSGSEYFSDGMTEELINALVQVPGLRVPARTSAFAFKGKTADIREIGRQLSVVHVVEGSVRRAGSTVRISVQLINVADGYHLWSNTYDRQVRRVQDVLGIQDEIARAIVAALEIKLARGDTAPLVRRSTDNPEAYDLYLRGRYFWSRRTGPDIKKAIEYLSRAIARDSSYAVAYSGLADAYLVEGNSNFIAPRIAFPRARAAALKALALDETLAEAHVSLGRLLVNYDWDPPRAEREFRRAIALNPGYALAHIWYALWMLRPQGRLDEALREARIGLRLDPLAPYMHRLVGNVLQAARRYDEAIEQHRRALEILPDWAGAHASLGDAYRGKGMLRDALAEYQRAQDLNPSDGNRAAIGRLDAETGRRNEAARILDQLRTRPDTEITWQAVAVIYVALGETDSALASLERAYQAAPASLASLKIGEMWDPLRSEPRFTNLLRKLGLQS